VASAQSPNEELYLLRRIAARAGATVTGVSWSPPGSTGDDFLVKADKNPNTAGLRLLGLDGGPSLDDLLAAVEGGRIRALVLHRSDVVGWASGASERVRGALERVPYVAVLDTHGSETAQYANLVLPIATYAEVDGTVTNHAGRVQRLREAVPPPGASRAGWSVLAELLARLEPGLAIDGAAQVFTAMAAEVPALSGVEFTGIGAHGVVARA
jgi:NADH-quinone oxidoreductase subunit G